MGSETKGTADNGAYNRMTRTGPQQPARCVGWKLLYEQPTYELFLKFVKRWMRTCVEEGREDELLDRNASLQAVWEELSNLPVSMDLERGRSITVRPVYEWETTSGPPFWRTKSITFQIDKQKSAPPIPQDDPQDSTPEPVKPCSRGVDDCKPPKPLPRTELVTYYYCSEVGVKSVVVEKGKQPPPQADAKSSYFTNELQALFACKQGPTDKQPTDNPKIPWRPPGDRTIKPPSKDDDSWLGDFFERVIGYSLSSFFGAIILFDKGPLLLESIFEIHYLLEFLEEKFPGQKIDLQLDKAKVNNHLSLNVIKDGRATNVYDFLDKLHANGVITEKEFHEYLDKAHEIGRRLDVLELERQKKYRRTSGILHTTRGYFIEDFYIENQLQREGYVGLPDWFPGFDAYQQGAKVKVSRIDGKFFYKFDNPGVISIKSYEPKGGLKNIDLDYLKRKLEKEWLPKMTDREVWERKHIRILNPRQQEIHLVLLGEEDPREYADKIKGLVQLAGDNKLVLKVVQYRRSVELFKLVLSVYK